MFCSFSWAFFFVGDKVSIDHFKDEIITSLKSNNRLKFSQDVAINHLIDKGKLRCNLWNKVFEEKSAYYPFLYISPFPSLIWLTDFLGEIQHCVTVFSKRVSNSNIHFVLPLTCDNLDYSCTNYFETKDMNGLKVLLKAIRFFTTEKIRVLFRSKNLDIIFML